MEEVADLADIRLGGRRDRPVGWRPGHHRHALSRKADSRAAASGRGAAAGRPGKRPAPVRYRRPARSLPGIDPPAGLDVLSRRGARIVEETGATIAVVGEVFRNRAPRWTGWMRRRSLPGSARRPLRAGDGDGRVAGGLRRRRLPLTGRTRAPASPPGPSPPAAPWWPPTSPGSGRSSRPRRARSFRKGVRTGSRRRRFASSGPGPDGSRQDSTPSPNGSPGRAMPMPSRGLRPRSSEREARSRYPGAGNVLQHAGGIE